MPNATNVAKKVKFTKQSLILKSRLTHAIQENVRYLKMSFTESGAMVHHYRNAVYQTGLTVATF